MSVFRFSACVRFQSTPSTGRATGIADMRITLLTEFQSTPSTGRATRTGANVHAVSDYFNPRPPRGGRLVKISDCHHCIEISIHALHGEGDAARAPMGGTKIDISIHALHGEGDPSACAASMSST